MSCLHMIHYIKNGFIINKIQQSRIVKNINRNFRKKLCVVDKKSMN